MAINKKKVFKIVNMKINREVLESILKQMPVNPPEIGGLIGGRGNCISIWQIDKGIGGKGCKYSPDVKYMNSFIAKWTEEGYYFMGILHVHFGGAKSLSQGDIKYIEKIMKAMPHTIKKLYFPIVVQPQNQLIPYAASINNEGNVAIELEEVLII